MTQIDIGLAAFSRPLPPRLDDRAADLARRHAQPLRRPPGRTRPPGRPRVTNDRERANLPIINIGISSILCAHPPSGTVSKLLRFVFDLANQIRSLGLVVITTWILYLFFSQ